MKSPVVLSVVSELFPLIKTGGLADVAGALPGALAGEGVRMSTLLPGYPAVLGALVSANAVHAWADLSGGKARLLRTMVDELDLLVLDAPHLFARPGNTYLAPDGRNWPDNALRFATLARVGAELGCGLLPEFVADIVHAHDWQAGLTPAYLHYRGGARPATIMTVHNLAFAGRFPSTLLERLGLPPGAMSIDGVEFYGDISMLKAGLQFADRITTVSPTYAVEICSEQVGMGFDGLLRARGAVLSGILNGIDGAAWDPAVDPHIDSRFDAGHIAARAANKAALQARLGLECSDAAPLFGVVSRLTQQKGLDLLPDVLPTLLDAGAQLAVLGTGEAQIEQALREAAAAWPGQIACVIGYDEALAHRMQAGIDALLVPSRFEPCGLTQLCALRYGAVPVVARVGGLADTVIDANPAALAAGVATGVQFAPVDAETLRRAIGRALALYRNSTVWRRIQANGMVADVSWSGPARQYAALYRDLLATRA